MNGFSTYILLAQVAAILTPLITSFAPPILLLEPQTFLQSHGVSVIESNSIGKNIYNNTLCIDDQESQLLDGYATISNSNTIHEATIQSRMPIGELPRHIAFICDGNSRWSKRQSLPKSMGHAAGAERVINVIKALQQYQSSYNNHVEMDQYPDSSSPAISQCNRIEYCTLYAFSTENWSRSQDEITAIFKLMERMAIQYRSHESVQSGKIQIDLLGNLEDERIPSNAKKEMQRLQRESKAASDKRRDELGNSANILTICLAINYGARADILQAAQKLAQSIASGELSMDEIAVMNESEISKRLCTAHIPDPDLIVRTSGETRLSNFLLWDAAYAELYFTDLMWPDFDDDALEEALVWYGRRKRRFGGRNE